MSKTLTTILIVLAVLIVAGGLFFVGTMFGRTTAFAPQNGLTQAWGNHPFGMGGMMGRFGGDKSRGYGPGMMGGYGYNYANVAPLTVDQAKAAAGKYVAALNNSDLAVGEVMIFDNNAYVVVKETSTGRGAFELLVDPVSQVAYPEHGPNMMWNLKYGGLNHQNMMGGYGWFGAVLVFLFGALVVAAIVLLVIWAVRTASGTGHHQSPQMPPSQAQIDEACAIARTRYAKGEITKEQYEEICKALGV